MPYGMPRSVGRSRSDVMPVRFTFRSGCQAGTRVTHLLMTTDRRRSPTGHALQPAVAARSDRQIARSVARWRFADL
jgi:hypothetical protein